jgi:nucleoside-diphosphate-sugar epimerase
MSPRAGIETVQTDITDSTGAAAAVDGSAVVYMAAQPAYHRWSEEFPAMLTGVIDAVLDTDARLVMVDNLYVYGPTAGAMREGTPKAAQTKKGKVRIQLAQMIEDAATSRGLRATIGRASDYFGPGADNSTITSLAIAPARAGKPIKWMGRLDRHHSVAFLPDVARAYVILGERDDADGRDWILPHGPDPTGAEFLAAVNATIPEPLRTGAISRTMLTMASPFHKMSRETLEMMYQWTEDFGIDDSAFRTAFGPFDSTPLDKAIAETLTA